MRRRRSNAAASALRERSNSSSIPSPRLFTSRPPVAGSTSVRTALTKRRQRSMTSSSCSCIRRTDSTTSTTRMARRTRCNSGHGASIDGLGVMLVVCCASVITILVDGGTAAQAARP
jgi:hypothetical protein